MAAFLRPRASRTTCRCTRDPLMLNVLLQRCGLGMRIALADVICTACHSRRRWHSLARTALAKHAAISCQKIVRQPSGGKYARPRRRRVACTSRGDFWTAAAGSSARMSCSCTVVSVELRREALAGPGARCRSSDGPKRCGYRFSIGLRSLKAIGQPQSS